MLRTLPSLLYPNAYPERKPGTVKTRMDLSLLLYLSLPVSIYLSHALFVTLSLSLSCVRSFSLVTEIASAKAWFMHQVMGAPSIDNP